MELRKKEKRSLLEKCTVVVGRELERWNNIELWTDTEISKATGVASNRLTEYKNFPKHGRAISEKHLLSLLGEGFVSMTALKKNVGGLTDREAEFLDDIEWLLVEVVKRE